MPCSGKIHGTCFPSSRGKKCMPKGRGGELMGRHSDRSLITLHESANLIRRLSGPVVAAHHRLKELLGDGVGGWPMHWHARRCTHVGVDKTRRDCGSTPHPKPNLLGSKMLPPPPTCLSHATHEGGWCGLPEEEPDGHTGVHKAILECVFLSGEKKNFTAFSFLFSFLLFFLSLFLENQFTTTKGIDRPVHP